MDKPETKLQEQEAISKFKQLAEDVNICMFTTLDNDNSITSRPMVTVNVDDEGNAWYFTNEYSEKIQEVSKDNVVNLIFSHPGKNIYVNVKGTCTVIVDKKKMEELWDSKMTKWFPDGLDDPKLCLIKVNTESAYYWNNETSKMREFFNIIKSFAKGESYKESDKGKLSLNAD
jgi:general stress protein 26